MGNLMNKTARLRSTRLALMAVMLTALAGCQGVGWVAEVIGGDGGDPPPIRVGAEYTDLADRKIAVLVASGPNIQMRYPTASLEVATVISRKIATHVPGARVVDPEDLERFKMRNLYWETERPGDLVRTLDVDRLILVDLDRFQLQEPGNSVMYMGRISGRMQVFEAEADDPDDAAYATQVRATYPPDSKVGIPEADPDSIRLGVLELFSMASAGKFYEHERPRE